MKYGKEFRVYATSFSCPFCGALPDQDCRVMFNVPSKGERTYVKSVYFPAHHKARLDRARDIISMEHGP